MENTLLTVSNVVNSSIFGVELM